MPIEALPINAVRAIGSTQALTDPNSVVKELVDNAIDAHATAIFVEISANTLDKIQVKDNGDGIAPADRKLLCTRYCTSKIRHLDDLRNIGGQPLGFRGEALASAVAMSGGLKLATRVEGEGTAVEFAYDPQGHATSEKRISHSIGTTVSVLDFLKNLPVRRQSAIKEAASTAQLARIKRTLQGYALARPRTRLSLRVLKSKSEKSNWSYAPKQGVRGDNDIGIITEDAATQIFGKSIISGCRWLPWKPSDSNSLVGSSLNSNLKVTSVKSNFEFQALLPTGDCSVDFSTLSLPRQFLFVDSRLVSCTRGTLKQIVSLFKKHFKSALPKNDKPQSVDPFLFLNIACGNGAYDVNIEPTKDDVLFEDPAGILDSAEKFFAHVYGNLTRDDEEHDPLPKKQAFSNADLLLAREREVPCSSPKVGKGTKAQHPRDIIADATTITVPNKPLIQRQSRSVQDISPNVRSSQLALVPTQGRLMCNDNIDDSSDFDILDDRDASDKSSNDQDEIDDIESINLSNPWTIAKVNASLRQPNGISSINTKSGSPVQQLTPRRQHGDVSGSPNASSAGILEGIKCTAHELPSPSPSSPSTFPYPLSARATRQERNGSNARLYVIAEDQQNRNLDAWINTSHPGKTRVSRSRIDVSEDNSPDDGKRRSYGNNFISAQSLPRGTSLNDIPDASKGPSRTSGSKKQRPTALNKPFVSPIQNPDRVWFETGQHNTAHQRRSQNSQPTQSSSGVEGPNLRGDQDSILSATTSSNTEPIHPDLALTLEYEARKQQAMQEYKANARRKALEAHKPATSHAAHNIIHSSQFSPSPSWSSPHKNRYLKAKAALQPSSSPILSHDKIPTNNPTFPPNDPRALLIHNLSTNCNEAAPPNSEHQSQKPSRRAKRTVMLPLENVAEEDSVRELSLSYSINVHEVAAAMEKAVRWDSYVADVGEGEEGLGGVAEGVTEVWRRRVELLVGEG